MTNVRWLSVCGFAAIAMLAVGAVAEDAADAPGALAEAERLAAEGQYKDAIAAFEKVKAENPDAIASIDGLRFAIVYAVGAGREEHLAHSRWLVNRYPEPDLATDAERTVKGYIVIPGVDDEALLQEALKRTRYAVEHAEAKGEGELLPWFHASLGVAYYRVGQYRAAAQSLSKATGDENEYTRSLALVFNAMAEHQLGNSDRANTLLEEAREVIKALPGPGTETYAEEWSDTLVAQLALEEAEALITRADQR